MTQAAENIQTETLSWKKEVAPFSKASNWRALAQCADSFIPYFVLWYCMYLSLSVSYWLTAALAVVAGAFLIRIFIIFHDCGHGSFFTSRVANDMVGNLASVLFLTPYYYWRWEHAVHHANSADLDNRGMGDIWTLTVEEYLAAPLWKKIVYRISRSPISLFFFGPTVLFLVWYRFPLKTAKPREKINTYITNVALLINAIALSYIFGWKQYFCIQIAVMTVAGAAGIWLFYVQHQYEGVYWERHDNWDFAEAALHGSSFYKLPKILQWFSGNIGFHHIHHLSPKVPNYFLEKCHYSSELFQSVKPLTIMQSLRSLNLRLYDEKLKQLVGFDHLRKVSR